VELSQSPVFGSCLEDGGSIATDGLAVAAVSQMLDQITLAVHPTDLDRGKTINRTYGFDETGSAIDNDQFQMATGQTPPIQIIQKGLLVDRLLRTRDSESDQFSVTIKILGQGTQNHLLLLKGTPDCHSDPVQIQITYLIRQRSPAE
jgi:hypothetical protein